MKREVKTLQPISNLFLKKKRTEHGAPQFLKLSESLKITIHRGNFILKINLHKNFFAVKFLRFHLIHEFFLTVDSYNMDKHLELF